MYFTFLTNFFVCGKRLGCHGSAKCTSIIFFSFFVLFRTTLDNTTASDRLLIIYKLLFKAMFDHF